MKKFVIISLLGLAGVLALCLVLCLGVVGVLYSEWGRDWALTQAQSALQTEAGITLEYRDARGRLPVRFTLGGVKLSQKGRVFFRAKSLTLAPNLAALLAGRAGLGLLRLEDPVLALPFPEFGSGGSGGGALPLVFFIRRLELKNADISPNREWGPVERIQGADLTGRLRFSSRSFRFEAERLAGAVCMQGMPQPVLLKGKARLTSLDDLKVDGVTLTMGGNRAELSGSLNWKDDLVFQAKVNGGFSDPGVLPMAWPGPHPPRGEIGFDLNAVGKIADCKLNGMLSLGEEKLGFAGHMDLATQAGKMELRPQGFNPVHWGLASQGLVLSGKISAQAKGPRRRPQNQTQPDCGPVPPFPAGSAASRGESQGGVARGSFGA